MYALRLQAANLAAECECPITESWDTSRTLLPTYMPGAQDAVPEMPKTHNML